MDSEARVAMAVDPVASPVTRALGVRIGVGITALFALAMLSSVIWSAVAAGAGLLVTGGICAVGAAMLQALPLLGQKWENRLLAMRKQEARENPIEQLQAFVAQKVQRVQQFRSSVVEIGTQIKSLEQMIADRKRRRHDYDASKQERQVEAMTAAHARMIEKLQRAEMAVQLLGERVEDKKFEWKFGQAGQAALKSLNASGGPELIEQMLADEAFDSVRDHFNQVFAELELESAQLHLGRPPEPDDSAARLLGTAEPEEPQARPKRWRARN